MKMEIRKFKKTSFLLLLPDNDLEIKTFDRFFGKGIKNYDNKEHIARLRTDDEFVPYIMVQKRRGDWR